MNAAAFRSLYDYHFAENRKIWDEYVTALTDEQFNRNATYAQGSIRNQLVHIMSVDDTWFSALRGLDVPEPLDPDDFADRRQLRAAWDAVEKNMRGYLADLRDGMLFEKPLGGEDENLFLWQALIQVVNHGTDHRAQILRLLNDLGVKTVSQDYIFYVYETQ
jgi:uncharacterized damage-inducible protein DinB